MLCRAALSQRLQVISGPAGHPLVVGHCNEHQQCSAIPDGPWIIGFDEFALEEEIEALLVEAEGLGFSRSTEQVLCRGQGDEAVQGAMTESGEQEKTLSTARTSKNTWCPHVLLPAQVCSGAPDSARTTLS